MDSYEVAKWLNNCSEREFLEVFAYFREMTAGGQVSRKLRTDKELV